MPEDNDKTIEQLKSELIRHFMFVGHYNSVKEIAHKTSKAKGFYDEEKHSTPATKIALMHEELSELLRLHRKDEATKPDEDVQGYTKEEVELADLFIRAFDYAGWRGLNIGGAIFKKMQFNLDRTYKHNKEF